MTPEQIREQWNQVGLEHLPVEYVVYAVAGVLVEIAAQLAETNRFLHDNKLYEVWPGGRNVRWTLDQLYARENRAATKPARGGK
jgi:hypothetical protein